MHTDQHLPFASLFSWTFGSEEGRDHQGRKGKWSNSLGNIVTVTELQNVGFAGVQIFENSYSVS